MIFYQLTKHYNQKRELSPPLLISPKHTFTVSISTFRKAAAVITIILCLAIIPAVAQNINLKLNNVPLRKAMNSIEQQSGYDFWYNKGAFNETQMVSSNFVNTPLGEVLKKIFEPRKVRFEILDKTIFLKPVEDAKPEPGKNNPDPGSEINGMVKDPIGKGIPNATLRIESTNIASIADENGRFRLVNIPADGILIVSSLGYSSKTIRISAIAGQNLSIVLEEDNRELAEVSVVSTGYQSIPKERATGSFTTIDNKILNRSVSSDIISRLKGVTNGLLLDKPGGGNTTGLNVRGRSTIQSDTQPLIIIDNFPFEGDINTINPNDIESITVLKDAAAASIWGTRAGNGVIVLTTKKGALNKQANIQINTNLTLGEKPDLYYKQQLSSAEYIEVEKFLFDKGAYTAMLNLKYFNISPVVEILQKIKENPSYSLQGNAEIERLKNIDVRDQQNEYFNRISSRQQYHAQINGGGPHQTYFFSGGFDKNLPNSRGSADSRISLKASNTYQLLSDKLTITTDLNFSKSLLDRTFDYTPYLPYEEVADAGGIPLSVQRSYTLRSGYTDTAGKGKLLDWKYRPLEELRGEYSTTKSKLTDYRILLGLNYKLFKSLSLSANYQYFSSNRKTEGLDGINAFTTRDLINRFSQINSSTGQVTRPVPLGALYSPSFSATESHYLRGQVNYGQRFAQDHDVNGIAGYEIRDEQSKSNGYNIYGYTPETGASLPIDPISRYRYYYSSATGTIPNNTRQRGTVDRYLSYYANASYSYKERYIFSGSYRKDESNIFGVEANQKGVPLWSAGFAWNIHKEEFISSNWLSQLQFKFTYGYNGNVNKSISAYLTAQPSGVSPLYGVAYNTIINPPNDALRWERVKNINTGIDFAIMGNRITGSLEYYRKTGLDLIGNSPIAPQTGVLTFTGNTADTQTNGFDIQINSINLNGSFKWLSSAIINYAKDKITDYKVTPGSNSAFLTGSIAGFSPLKGYPIRSMFAYKWNGLDALGNPQGELDGVTSTDYARIRNSTDNSQLVYFGSQSPTLFGSLRNTFSYQQFEFSFNIIYKFNYFFRRSSINYQTLYGTGSGYQQADYGKRWQNPGDELLTSVPAAIYPSNANRNDFYSNAAVLVERADHIRLQDIQLSYGIAKSPHHAIPFSRLDIYAYANNIGLLWKANRQGLDPDAIELPVPRTLAIGLKITL